MMPTRQSVRIVRFANEGFDVKRETGGLAFYDTEVLDYRSEYRIIRGKDPIMIQRIEGCYCHFYKFDLRSLKENGILATRKGQTLNVGYLPLTHSVYARNMRPDDNKSRIVRVYKEVQNPSDKSIHLFEDDSYWDAYAWVRMRLSLLLERTEEYMKINNTNIVPEHLSEVFLTPNDLILMQKKKRFFYLPLRCLPLIK